jgi:hypothetical protein
LAKAKKWGQLHTDGTGRRQIAMQDLSFSIQNDEDGLFEPLLLTSSIIPKDECSETIAEAVLEAINTKASHLDGWAAVHEKMGGQWHSGYYLGKACDGLGFNPQ